MSQALPTTTVHSPAPWTFRNGSIFDANNRLIADVWPTPHSEEWSLAEPFAIANASLMRAAPQLAHEMTETIAWIESIASEAERIGPLRPSCEAQLRQLCVKLRGRARLITLSMSALRIVQ